MLPRCLFVLLTLGVVGLCSWTSTAKQPVASGNPLRLVPEDAILYLHLQGSAFWSNPAFEELKKRMPADKWQKLEKELFEVSEQITTIPRRNFESATIIVSSWDVPQLPGFAFIIQSSVPLQPRQFTNSVKKYFKQKFPDSPAAEGSSTVDGVVMEQVTSFQGKNLFACQLDTKTNIVGDDETLKKMIHRRNGSAIASFARTSPGTELALGLQLSEDLRNQLSALMQMVAPRREGAEAYDLGYSIGTNFVRTLMDVNRLKLEAQLLRDLSLNLKVEANSEPAAIRFQRALDALALVGDFGLHHLQEIAVKKDNELHDFQKLFTSLAKACLESKVTRQGSQVTLSLNSPGSGQEFSIAMASFLPRLEGMQGRATRQSNLRQMAIAMHNYHNDYSRLPSAGYYTGGNGMQILKDPKNPNSKLGLSWRVAILPYIEQDQLFKQFRTNEPWDSEHNKKLIAKMPKLYAMPGVEAGEGLTHYQVFVAPEKPADPQKQRFAPIFTWGGRPLTLGQLAVQDGTSNTIMIAEAAKPVIWTKPDDLDVPGDDQPLPKLGCVPDENDFFVVFGDASVRSLKRSLPNAKEYEKLLRQLIGRRDGMNENVEPIMSETRRSANREFRQADAVIGNPK